MRHRRSDDGDHNADEIERDRRWEVTKVTHNESLASRKTERKENSSRFVQIYTVKQRRGVQTQKLGETLRTAYVRGLRKVS